MWRVSSILFAHLLGLDGYILTAFILGLSANEIVIPIIMLELHVHGALVELQQSREIQQLFHGQRLDLVDGPCTMLFCLNHFPRYHFTHHSQGNPKLEVDGPRRHCSPTLVGMLLCFIVTRTVRLLGLV